MTYTIETYSTAPGSVIQQHEDDGSPRLLARQYAQRRANASDAESSATVLDPNGCVVAEAWADPKGAQ